MGCILYRGTSNICAHLEKGRVWGFIIWLCFESVFLSLGDIISLGSSRFREEVFTFGSAFRLEVCFFE